MLIAGVDEAGRGPLAGSVMAAAVILCPNNPIIGLNDSKKLTEKKRELLYDLIVSRAKAWSVASVTPAIIDKINILAATMLAMQQAVAKLGMMPDLVQVDGNRAPEFGCKAEAIIGGDALVDAISAASIIAKVTRDRSMLALDQVFPVYNFAQHKGYGTKLHIAALEKYGPCPEHRRSFAPVRRVCQKGG